MKWLSSLLKEVRRCAIVIQRAVKSWCLVRFKIRTLNEKFFEKEETLHGDDVR